MRIVLIATLAIPTRVLISCAMGIALMGSFGCAMAPKSSGSPSSSTAPSGNPVGKIAIVPLSDPADVALQKPYNKEDAAKLHQSSDEKGSFGLGPPAHGGGGQGAIFLLAAIPVVIAVEAIAGPAVQRLENASAKAYGHFLGESDERLKVAVAAMTNALAELSFEKTLRQRIGHAFNHRAHSPLLISQPRADIHPASAEVIRAFYQDLAGQGVDTVIEVEVGQAALTGRDRINPPLALTVELRFRTIRLQDGKELDLFSAKYRGAKRRFVEWARDDARPFRDEVESCYQSLTSQIATRRFSTQ